MMFFFAKCPINSVTASIISTSSAEAAEVQPSIWQVHNRNFASTSTHHLMIAKMSALILSFFFPVVSFRCFNNCTNLIWSFWFGFITLVHDTWHMTQKQQLLTAACPAESCAFGHVWSFCCCSMDLFLLFLLQQWSCILLHQTAVWTCMSIGKHLIMSLTCPWHVWLQHSGFSKIKVHT